MGVRPRIAIVDYGAGNVRSARRGFEAAGGDSYIAGEPSALESADVLVIPGVGHFSSCLANLRASGLESAVRRWIDSQQPVFGICVGMQLLYATSEEGDEPGLGLLPGKVVRFSDDVVVPHMGWDVVRAVPSAAGDQLLSGVHGQRFYFTHAYYAIPDDPSHVIASCTYGGADFPCLVREGSVVGTQFHPEKSGVVGQRLLSNWLKSLT